MRTTLQTLAVVFGVVAAVSGLLLGFLLVGLGAAGGDAQVLPLTVGLAVAAVGLLAGSFMAVASLRGLRGQPSPPLGLPSLGLMALLLAVLLVLGEALRRTDAAPLLLPPLHLVASLLPPLIVVGLVTTPLIHAGLSLSRRDLVMQFTFGTLAATILAGTLEITALLGLAALGGALLLLVPGGVESLESLARSLQPDQLLQNPEALLSVLLSPALVLAALLFAALLVPVIEEFVKSLGVLSTGLARGRLAQGQAYSLGVMAGVGFSFAEALFYGAAQLPASWAVPLLLRGSTAAVHGLATGLMGLAWYELVMRRNRTGFALLAVASIAIHGAWNAGSAFLALASIYSLQGPVDSARGGLGVLAAAVQGTLFLLVVGLLIGITRQLARNSAPTVTLRTA